jgi:S1-C subfamily serine protease
VRLTTKLLPLLFLTAGTVAPQSAPPRKDIPTIAKAANGAIVSIITSGADGKPLAQGTGFLVSTDGRIVTNYHVIDGASSAIVKLPDGAFYNVDGVFAFDKARDLAVIKAHGQNFRVVTLGNSDRVQVGEEIVAIGSPLSLESTVSSGLISGIRNIKEEGGRFLQITAPISPGSSGGPVFNMSGEVIGITTLYLENGENLNFAIPINDAKHLISVDSKMQDFPVQTEANAEAAPPPPVPPATARDYYTQLYAAGGFSQQTGASSVFACFNDDPSEPWFFTISVMAYDERYAEAYKAHAAALLDKSKNDSEDWHTMQSIQASAPDVHFLSEDSLGHTDTAWAGTEKYLRSGGRILTETPYYKGVGGNEIYYRGTEAGHIWTFAQVDEEASISFEPATLRYVMRLYDVGSAQVHELGAGMCERIPNRQPN